MASPDLLGLPNETKLNILAALPTKDIQCARRVCTYLRDLIDERSNFDFLVRNGRQSQIAQLRENVDYLCDINQTADFLAAVKITVGRRGLWEAKSMLILGNQVTRRWLLTRLPSNGDTWTHFALASPYSFPDRHETAFHSCFYDTGARNWRAEFDVVGLTQEALERYYDTIVETPGGYLQPTIGSSTDLWRPEWTVGSWADRASHEETTKAEDICRLLGVEIPHPDLGEICGICNEVSNVWDFAYHVRSEWALREIQAALREEEESEESEHEEYVFLSEHFGPLKKVALLEELYLL